jgi:hypothetical protein
VSRLIQNLLREALARPEAQEPPEPPFRVVTFGDTGLQPGARWESLQEIDDDLP